MVVRIIEAVRRASRLALLVTVVTIAAGACAPVGPNYKRPPVTTPAQYRFVESPSDAESLADLPWWRVFEDTTLQALIREAIANNLDLHAAAARVERARAEAGVAKALLYPQVDGAAGYTIQQNSGNRDADDPQHALVAGFQLSWEIDLFGRLRREHEAAVALMLASEQGRRGVLVTLVGDVASTYFQLRELDLELNIARQTVDVADETVTYFTNRVNGGVSNQLELDRVTAFRAEAAAAIPDFERQIAIAEDALSLLLGRAPGPITRESVAVLPPTQPAIPPGLPASLLERRPDVAQAEEQLVAANADIGAAQALFFPAISLTGFGGGISGNLFTLLGGSGAVWQTVPSLVQPVFNAGRLRHNKEAAQASFDESLALYQKAALNGYREVADALVTIEKLADVHVQQQLGVTALQNSSRLARVRYDTGLANYIEILTADQDLFAQQLLLAATEGKELRARAELYRALGGGWQP
jgi:multidrug efflux system outer membrane protein